jgi:hypothetical protein
MSALPEGWTEAWPGGMATNRDPDLGGIVDRTILHSMGKAMPGGWFVVFHRDGLATVEELPSREEAFEAFAEAMGLDADEFLGRTRAPGM